MQPFDAIATERADKLVGLLLEKLERLKDTARALAEYEANIEQHIQLLDGASQPTPLNPTR